MTDPAFSVVVLSYNSEVDLPGCLESLRRSLVPFGPTEVILIDNGSSDGTVQIGRASSVVTRVVERRVNSGYAGGMNFGISVASQDLVLIVTPDTRISEGALTSLLTTACACPKSAVVGCKFISGTTGKVDSEGGIILFPTGHAITNKRLSGDSGRIQVPYVEGALMMVRRPLFIGLGGFSEDLFSYYDEVDLCIRSWLRGLPVILDRRAEVVHFSKGSFGRHLELRAYLLNRNRILVTASFSPRGFLLPFVLGELMVLTATIVISPITSDGEHVRGHVRALAWTLKNLRKIRERREKLGTAFDRRAYGGIVSKVGVAQYLKRLVNAHA
jgi:hypothetical protein